MILQLKLHPIENFKNGLIYKEKEDFTCENISTPPIGR